jgi:predicted nucleotide-binding protein (sugar kinase/HSP70/actin superfamily)
MSAINNDLDTQQSMRSVDYLLEQSKFIHNNQCRAEFGIVGGNDVSQTKSSLVDIENDLKGITRTSNKCVEYNYIPTQNNVLEPIKYIKTTDNPKLDLNKKHLKNCNFFDMQEVPKEPKLPYDKCDFAKF